MSKLAEYLEKLQKDKKLKVIVAVDQQHLDRLGKKVLEEVKKVSVGKQTAFRHQPHFQGGEYHGHCDLPGGYQVSWTISGQRLHSNKFPADDKIPKDVKMAVAKVLGVPVDLLEGFLAYDKKENKEIILFELKGESRAARFLRENRLLIDKNNGKA
jgi:hypothetical protein